MFRRLIEILNKIYIHTHRDKTLHTAQQCMKVRKRTKVSIFSLKKNYTKENNSNSFRCSKREFCVLYKTLIEKRVSSFKSIKLVGKAICFFSLFFIMMFYRKRKFMFKTKNAIDRFFLLFFTVFFNSETL